MISTEYLLIIILSIIVLVLVGVVWRIEYRIKKLFRGKKGSDLEESLTIINETLSALKSDHEKTIERVDIHNGKLNQSLRGIHTVRFNPFPELGSNQSFAIAILNESGDGVVLSSLYTRERVSVFAKPIRNMHSEYELTEEEKEALLKAKI